MKDIIIPIVFPEYRISLNTSSVDVDLFPWVSFDNFKIPPTKISDLGHAGVFLVNGKNGVTKYYEYGRYDPPENKGLVQRVILPDAKMDQKGMILSSLIPALDKICKKSGQGGRIEGVFLEASNVFDKLNNMIRIRKSQNNLPGRRSYDLISNSCIHFVKGVVKAAGKDTPWMIDPRPNSYIGEFRNDYRDLDYSPKTKLLRIEDVGEFKQ